MAWGIKVATNWQRWGLRIAAIGILVANHVRVLPDAAVVEGLPLVLDHLFNLGVTFALIVLSTAIGSTLLRRVALDIESAIEQLALATALGAALVAAVMLCCAVLGGLSLTGIGLSLGAVALAARKDLASTALGMRAAWHELGRKGGLAAQAVVCLAGLALILLAISPPSDYDSLMYHVQIPAKFVERGAIFVPEDNLHVAFVGLVHFLYLPLLAIGAPSACAILNGCFMVLTALTLFAVVSKMLSNSSGFLSLLLLWGSGILILTAATPKVDVALVYFLLVGHTSMLRALADHRGRRRYVVIAGLLFGSAFGIKYLALLYIGPVVLVDVLWRLNRGDRKREILAALTALGAAVVIAAMPWLAKNQALLGAPLYPYFTERLPRPWLGALYEARGVEWKMRARATWIRSAGTSALSSVREPFDFVAWFVSPERLTPELEGRAYAANPAFLLVPLAPVALWRLRNRRAAALLLPGLGFLMALLWARERINLRYMIPALPMLTVAAAIALDWLVARLSASGTRLAVMAVSLGVSLYPTAKAVAQKMEMTGVVSHAIGLRSREEFLRTETNHEVAGYSRLVARANEQVPDDSLVLFLFEGRGFGFNFRVLQDNGLSNWPLLLPLVQAPNCLEGSGITHVLVGLDTLEYFRKRGLDLKRMRFARFWEFADRCLELVDSGEGMRLYRVTEHRRSGESQSVTESRHSVPHVAPRPRSN